MSQLLSAHRVAPGPILRPTPPEGARARMGRAAQLAMSVPSAPSLFKRVLPMRCVMILSSCPLMGFWWDARSSPLLQFGREFGLAPAQADASALEVAGSKGGVDYAALTAPMSLGPDCSEGTCGIVALFACSASIPGVRRRVLTIPRNCAQILTKLNCQRLHQWLCSKRSAVARSSADR